MGEAEVVMREAAVVMDGRGKGCDERGRQRLCLCKRQRLR
jgi:hypothetical protein